MAASTLVAGEIDAGKKLIPGLFRQGVYPVNAFWRHLAEAGEWRLFFVVPERHYRGPDWGYRAVQRALKQEGLSSSLSLSQIAVVDSADSWATWFRDTWSGGAFQIRSSSSSFEGQPVSDDVIVYRST